VIGMALPAVAQDARKSGFDFMGPDTQAMQKDDLANPGMLSVLEGETLWNTPAGKTQKSCASCHGADGTGGKAGSVVDRDYLNLVSNQYLRTVTIAGRPELGCPDFAHRNPSHPMTATEISDVVAWLTSHRVNEFDRPVSNMKAK
jgi:mono/diheme cytochrome c family protein